MALGCLMATWLGAASIGLVDVVAQKPSALLPRWRPVRNLGGERGPLQSQAVRLSEVTGS
jgi:hypothetical protein